MLHCSLWFQLLRKLGRQHSILKQHDWTHTSCVEGAVVHHGGSIGTELEGHRSGRCKQGGTNEECSASSPSRSCIGWGLTQEAPTYYESSICGNRIDLPHPWVWIVPHEEKQRRWLGRRLQPDMRPYYHPVGLHGRACVPLSSRRFRIQIEKYHRSWPHSFRLLGQVKTKILID